MKTIIKSLFLVLAFSLKAFSTPMESYVIPFIDIGPYDPNAPLGYTNLGDLVAIRAPLAYPTFIDHQWNDLYSVVTSICTSNGIAPLPSNVAYLGVSQTGNLNVSTITIGSSTNSPSFITGNTNWTDGQVYVNQTGRNVWVEAPCLMTPALLAGNSVYSLVVSNSSSDIITNSSAAPSLLALLIPANPGFVCGIVKPNGYWWFTNKSTAGTAVMNGKGQYEVR